MSLRNIDDIPLREREGMDRILLLLLRMAPAPHREVPARALKLQPLMLAEARPELGRSPEIIARVSETSDWLMS